LFTVLPIIELASKAWVAIFAPLIYRYALFEMECEMLCWQAYKPETQRTMKELFRHYSIEHFINRPHHPTAFEITRFEDMEEPDVDDVHKHTFYEILWVDEGHSRQTIDYRSYELGANSLFFISPGQLHEFEEWQPLKGGTIMFTADFFLINQQNQDKLFELSFLDNVYANPNLQLALPDFQEIRRFIDLLMAEKKRENSNPQILQSLLHVLLLQIQRSVDAHADETVSKRTIVVFKNFKNLLEKHFKSDMTVQDYAAALNITQHHLNRVAKAVTGKTATEVIRERSLLEAKRLLTFSDYSVAEIAAELGYFDNSYFTKMFRKDVGSTPTEYKSEMSEKYRRRSFSG
jgi:AraC-like DNA-binding protein/mannose-6-phosphate isomerase-like protein (cupin superfamily)